MVFFGSKKKKNWEENPKGSWKQVADLPRNAPSITYYVISRRAKIKITIQQTLSLIFYSNYLSLICCICSMQKW